MKKLLVPIALAIIVIIGVNIWYRSALEPVQVDAQQRKNVRIEAGSSLSAIADQLHQAGVIRSAVAFRWHARLNNLETSLQAGHYVLTASLSVPELVEILQAGRGQEAVVTIPEGFTVTDIDALLAELRLLEPGAFLDCAQHCDLAAFAFLPAADGFLPRAGLVEGYLYPDTFFVAADGFSAEQFLHRLLHTFQSKVVTELAEGIETSNRTLHEIVTMASLIEEEAITDAERSIISGILWKRYDEGMGLGVDATVRYLVNKPTAAITVADLNENSPYNTRKFRGLPPSPIASPGLESIRAALKPQATEYWYYLHDANGQIHYAKTNEEHNLNRHRYL